MSVELSPAEAYFYNKLSSDPTMQTLGLVGFFSEQAPNDTLTPYVVWSQIGASDITTQNGVRIMATAVYYVRVVGQVRSYAPIRPIADQIDALLHKSTGVALGHTIDACVREAPYSFVQNKGDYEWRHLGGRYRIWVSA